MKKLSYILFIAASVLATACAKEVSIDDTSSIETPSEIIVPEETVTYTFTVNASAKSSLTNGGAFSWVAGDHIAIYNSATSSYVTFSVTSVDGSGNATITADAAAGAVWTNAIYPAERATGAGNGVDYAVQTVSGPILVSKVDGQTLSFKYLGAVANIQVNDVPGEPTKLTFTANANVFGSRTFSWSGETPVLGGEGSQASITVPFTNNTIISVPIPQVSYAGFTITVDNAAGRHLYKKTTANTFDMTSKKLLPMPTLAYTTPRVYYLKTVATQTDYWSQADMPFIQTGANEHSITVNVDRMSTYYIYDEWNTDAPTTHYVATGSTTSDTHTDNTFTIIGVCNSWTLENNSTYVMNRIGNWNYIHNASGLHNTEFKFNPYDNTSNWALPWGFDGDKAAWFNIAEGPYTLSMVQNRSNTGLWCGGEGDKPVDIYLNTSSSEGQCYPTGYKGNPLCSLVRFVIDNSTDPEEISVNIDQSQAVSKPFSNTDFPTGAFALIGKINSWGDTTTGAMTYDGNMSWSGEITPSGTSLSFKLTNTSQSGYWAGVKTGLGSSLYGDLLGDSEFNASVTLESGATYKVYVNATTGWIYNIMFVKQ